MQAAETSLRADDGLLSSQVSDHAGHMGWATILKIGPERGVGPGPAKERREWPLWSIQSQKKAGVPLVSHLAPGRGSKDVPSPFSFLSLLGTNSSALWEEGLGLSPAYVPMAVWLWADGPSSSQSYDLPLNWIRGSLFLLFFLIPFWKMKAFWICLT